MAAIDHTVIVYKNGEYVKDPFMFDEDGVYFNLCPFDYSRDGEITAIYEEDGTKIEVLWSDIKWYHDEYDAIYERAGIHGARLFPITWWKLLKILQWKLHIVRRCCYTRDVGVWRSGDVEIYFYRNIPGSTYVSFYKDSTDTYVLLGGYGHLKNPYTHFMQRGYGDEFESKMAAEAYQWLCRDVLRAVADNIFDTWDEANTWFVKTREDFNYKLDW